MEIKKGSVTVRAIGRTGELVEGVDVLDLDSDSFRRFILDKLAMQNIVFAKRPGVEEAIPDLKVKQTIIDEYARKQEQKRLKEEEEKQNEERKQSTATEPEPVSTEGVPEGDRQETDNEEPVGGGLGAAKPKKRRAKHRTRKQ